MIINGNLLKGLLRSIEDEGNSSSQWNIYHIKKSKKKAFIRYN